MKISNWFVSRVFEDTRFVNESHRLSYTAFKAEV